MVTCLVWFPNVGDRKVCCVYLSVSFGIIRLNKTIIPHTLMPLFRSLLVIVDVFLDGLGWFLILCEGLYDGE